MVREVRIYIIYDRLTLIYYVYPITQEKIKTLQLKVNRAGNVNNTLKTKHLSLFFRMCLASVDSTSRVHQRLRYHKSSLPGRLP